MGAVGNGPGPPCTDLGFWYSPQQLEPPSEDEEEDQWIDFRQHWDVSSDDSDAAFNFCALEKSLVLEEPLPACSPPSALEVKMRRLPAPWGHQLTAEVRGDLLPVPPGPARRGAPCSAASCPPAPLVIPAPGVLGIGSADLGLGAAGAAVVTPQLSRRPDVAQ